MNLWMWIALSALAHGVGAILAYIAWRNQREQLRADGDEASAFDTLLDLGMRGILPKAPIGSDPKELPGLIFKTGLFFFLLGIGLTVFLLKTNFLRG